MTSRQNAHQLAKKAAGIRCKAFRLHDHVWAILTAEAARRGLSEAATLQEIICGVRR